MRRYELSDTQWDQIEDLFPTSPHSRGRPRREDRLLLNAIFWILCSGAAWRDLPERYGPWQTAYDRFRQWKGIVARIDNSFFFSRFFSVQLLSSTG